jgi:hypothetical protein
MPSLQLTRSIPPLRDSDSDSDSDPSDWRNSIRKEIDEINDKKEKVCFSADFISKINEEEKAI